MPSSSVRARCWANSVPLSKVMVRRRRRSSGWNQVWSCSTAGCEGLPGWGGPRVRGGGEEHEVGFPVSEGAPTVDGGGPQGDGNTAFDEIVGRALVASLRAALVLGSGQVVAPGAIVGAPDLGVDEAVDALMADGGSSLLLLEPAGDLLGRPAARQAVEHEGAQRGIAFQARALPAAAACLLLGVGRLVADLAAAVALQLARQARWRAIQSCRDLADRLAGLVKLGNRAPLFEREVTIVFAHRNTLSWCCTSFVNSGGPFLRPERSFALRLRMTIILSRACILSRA